MNDAPASVVAIENPYTDPITVAWSKVDVRAYALGEFDPEAERLRTKLAKAEQVVKDVKEALAVNKAGKADATVALEEAHAELDAACQADPELAVVTANRREADRLGRIAQLEAALAALKGK